MLAVQVRCGLQGDKELRRIGISAAIGHGQQPCTRMSPGKTLVIKGATIDRKAAFPSCMTDITALKDKAINNAMEFGVKVVEFGVVGTTVLSCAEATEVL
jgi:hypothetical protein